MIDLTWNKIHNIIIRILTGFIPSSKFRKIFREKFLRTNLNIKIKDIQNDLVYINMKLSFENYIKRDSLNLVLSDGIGDTIQTIRNHNNLKFLYKSNIFYFIRPSHEVIMKMYGIPRENYICTKLLDKRIPLPSFLPNVTDIPQTGVLFFCHPFASGIDKIEAKNFTIWWEKFLKIPTNSPKLPIVWQPNIEKDFIRKLTKYGDLKNFVILSPEISSVAIKKSKFWHALAIALKKEGYIVVQNTINKSNKIDNVLNLDINLSELVALTKMVKALISARSGLCDLCYEIGEHLFITDGEETQSYKEFYSIKDNYNKFVNDNYELKYKSINQIIEKINNL